MKKIILLLPLFIISLLLIIKLIEFLYVRIKYGKPSEKASIGIIGGDNDPDEIYSIDDIEDFDWDDFINHGFFEFDNFRVKSLIKKKYKNAAISSWFFNNEDMEIEKKPSLVKAVITTKKFDGHNLLLDIDIYSSTKILIEAFLTLSMVTEDKESVKDIDIELKSEDTTNYFKAIKNIDKNLKHGSYKLYIKKAKVKSKYGEIIGLYPNQYLYLDK